MSTLTSANSVFTIICPQVFSIPQLIQGYATEDMFNVPQFEVARAVMGCDGKMSGGFVPAVKELDVVLQADSVSRKVFQRLLGAMESAREAIFLDAVIVLPGTAEIWNFSRGLITKAPKIPPAKKMLEPTTWQITWEDIQPSGI